jgi:hypothetical protein
MRVADRGVGRLHAERLNELQQGIAKGRALLRRLAQLRRRNGVTISGRLDIGGVGRAVVAGAPGGALV